ncbi:MAG TPA: CHAT domain-containing protein [Polyangiaceae bacterium]|nr:CHAT domain-containing protein [Polyangiaceae bacterium]
MHTEQLASGVRVDLPVQLDQAAGTLTLALAGEVVLRVHLRRSATWSWQAEVRAASAAETLARLQPRLVAAVGAERSKLARAVAESAIALGQRSYGLEVLADGAHAALASQRASEARSHWLRLAYNQAQAHDFAAAEAALRNARAVPSSLVDGDGEAAFGYVSGWLATNLHDLRGAARAYEDAQTWVERGAVLMAPQVAVARARIAEQQGRLRDALELLESALHSSLVTSSACFRALATARAGWFELELNPRDPALPSVKRARDRLREASGIYGTECTTAPPADVGLTELYLGFAALRYHEVGQARTALARAGDFATAPQLRLWRNLLASEIRLAEGQADAAESSFRELEADARRHLSWELAWRAAEGAARSLVARRQLEAALAEFRRAEELLVASMDWFSVDAGALQFLDTHHETTEGLAATLIELGRVPDAFAALRHARRRLVVGLARNAELGAASLEKRESLRTHLAALDNVERLATELETCPVSQRAFLEARLATEQRRAQATLDPLTDGARLQSTAEDPLRSPEPAEALLLWTEIGTVWHGFFELDREVQHVSQSHEPSARGWLSPFESQLARAQRLTVLSEGALAEVDLHAIARAILPELRVVYSLDLPAHRPMSFSGPTLVTGDPLGDLPNAQREATRIAELARASGPVELLTGPALTMSEFARAASRAQRLHYGGHATFWGVDGWQSELQMARGAISPAEILALPHAPDEVVLSACSAGRDAGLLHSQSLGLAQAFLLAGGRSVVAPTRSVSDRAARRLSLELWQKMATGKALADAYHLVFSKLAPDDELFSFRLFAAQ